MRRSRIHVVDAPIRVHRAVANRAAALTRFEGDRPVRNERASLLLRPFVAPPESHEEKHNCQQLRRYPDPEALSAALPEELEEVIRSTGFFRNKTRNLIGMATALVEEHGGNLPGNMKERSALPGSGRKTANVILGNAFGIDEGVVVDTHVKRLSRRMGLTAETTPEKIERDMMALFPRRVWTMLAHLLIWHGRQVCNARRPRCNQCPVSHRCPSSAV